MSTLGTATTVTSAVPSPVRVDALSAKLPARTLANTNKIISHRMMLNESTEPSASPAKKKYMKMSATMASIPQGIQKNSNQRLFS